MPPPPTGGAPSRFVGLAHCRVLEQDRNLDDPAQAHDGNKRRVTIVPWNEDGANRMILFSSMCPPYAAPGGCSGSYLPGRSVYDSSLC